jgi:hypothetical protein
MKIPSSPLCWAVAIAVSLPAVVRAQYAAKSSVGLTAEPIRSAIDSRPLVPHSDQDVIAGLPADTVRARKEPFVAGVLSWLVPGLGSYYAGNNRHGTRHLVLFGTSFTIMLVGASQAVADCDGGYYGDTCGGDGLGLMAVGLLSMVTNTVWGIVTAVSDANAHNRAIPAATGVSVLHERMRIDPQVTMLHGATSSQRLGIRIARVAF